MDTASLRKKLHNNEVTIGSWITLGHPAIPEIMSHANFDWLVVDIEHTIIDLPMVQNLISITQSRDMLALVRVSKNEEVVIKRVLDAGADGVIVPMINSQEEAERAVKYAKYPPYGTRGVGLARAQGYGYQFDDYLRKSSELIVIAQIEHYHGINNLESILSVEGIDGSLIGPYDLSSSLGKPGDFGDDEVAEKLETYKSICNSLNRPMGYHMVSSLSSDVKQKIKEGYTFIAFGTDFYFLGDRAIEEMNKLALNK